MRRRSRKKDEERPPVRGSAISRSEEWPEANGDERAEAAQYSPADRLDLVARNCSMDDRWLRAIVRGLRRV